MSMVFESPVGKRGMCRVLIANQQPIVRHGVRALLADEPDVEVVAEIQSEHEKRLVPVFRI